MDTTKWKQEKGFNVFVGDARCYLCVCELKHTQAEHDAEIARPKMPDYDWESIDRDEYNAARSR